MAKFISFLKTHPLCTAIIAIVVAMFSIKMLPAETFLQEGIIHGGYDFILSFSNAFTQTGMESSGYVVAGKGAVAVCVVYLVTGLITAFITWRIWKSVKKDLDFEKLRQEW